MIVEFYKERKYSLNHIRWAAQRLTSFNEASCTGINYVEALNALRYLGVNHYRLATGVGAAFVKSKTLVGPVLVGVHYGSYPNKYNSGRSNRAEAGGRDDYGFYGAHAVLAEKYAYHNGHTDMYMRDPDHGSASRPYKPNYDRIKTTQLQTTMVNLPRYTAFSSTYVLYPTVKKASSTSTPEGTLRVKVTCDTVARRSTSTSSDKIGSVNSGDILTVTATSEGGNWSGCGKTGNKWRKVTHVNGRSTMSKWGRAYVYVAAGLTRAV